MRQEISTKTHVGIACLSLFLLSLFLTAYSAKNPAVARLGTTAVLYGVAPILQAGELVRGGCAGLWDGYINLIHAAQENRELKKQLSNAEGRLVVSQEAERENLRLRELLNFSSERQLRGVTAAVIGGDPSGWVKGLVIDKGRADGVTPGMAVIHPQGVVGQVVSVTDHAARILLVSDHASGVDVLMQTSRARGVIEGAGERVCELTFLAKDVQVRVGEQVITSGMDGIYPKGLLVGHVSQVGAAAVGLFQPIEVKPSVDLSRLEEVLVVPSSVSDRGVVAPNASTLRGQGGG